MCAQENGLAEALKVHKEKLRYISEFRICGMWFPNFLPKDPATELLHQQQGSHKEDPGFASVHE